MSLGDLQRLMREAFTAPNARHPAVAAAAATVNSSTGLSALEHVDIYRRAVQGTLARALGDIHPVCRRLVGDEFFAAMARAYVREHPSRSPDLADYGEHYGDFIAAFAPAAALPYLADVARLEWCWHRAFHAPDTSPLDATALAAVPEPEQEGLVFELPASAHLLSSPYPVHRIWQVNQPEWVGDETVSLDEGAVRLLVWRQGYDMRIDPLDEGEWWLLNRLASGERFGALAAEPAPEALDTLLPRCVGSGWIAGFRLAN